MTAWTAPRRLRPGDTVAVVAPSSPFGRDDFWRGLAWLRDRYRIVASPSILDRAGYLAGSDERRHAELAHAMTNPEVDAIVAARGGYGATRILDGLPWAEFAKQPKWIVGFSDITALHLEASARSIASIHGPHVTGLGRADAPTRYAFLRALESAEHAPLEELTTLHPGSAEGPVVGGNLSLLYAMAAANRLAVPQGSIVLLEDVTERPYRIDRMLTALLPHLKNAAGIVFGSFTQCEPGPDGATVEEVLVERTKALKIPVLANAPFGHEDKNIAVVLGADARLDPGLLRFASRF